MPGSVGRPREFDETDVLTQIMKQFWTYGYEGTALSDIIGATGLQKGSLYKAFGSKLKMYNLALSLYEQTAVKQAEELLKSPAPAFDRLKAFLSFPIDAAFINNDRRGCFLCNASSDYSGADPETLEQIQRGYKKLSKALSAAVADLKADTDEKTAENTAQMLLAIYSGLRIMARTTPSPAPLEKARDAALQSL